MERSIHMSSIPLYHASHGKFIQIFLCICCLKMNISMLIRDTSWSKWTFQLLLVLNCWLGFFLVQTSSCLCAHAQQQALGWRENNMSDPPLTVLWALLVLLAQGCVLYVAGKQQKMAFRNQGPRRWIECEQSCVFKYAKSVRKELLSSLNTENLDKGAKICRNLQIM